MLKSIINYIKLHIILIFSIFALILNGYGFIAGANIGNHILCNPFLANCIDYSQIGILDFSFQFRISGLIYIFILIYIVIKLKAKEDFNSIKLRFIYTMNYVSILMLFISIFTLKGYEINKINYCLCW